MVNKKIRKKTKNKSNVEPVLSSDEIAEFKDRYDPDLVDTLLTEIDGNEFLTAFNFVLDKMLDQSPSDGAFNNVALTRRKHEVSLIEQEARMFEQIANMMEQMSTRYAVLTGVPVVSSKKEGTSNA